MSLGYQSQETASTGCGTPQFQVTEPACYHSCRYDKPLPSLYKHMTCKRVGSKARLRWSVVYGMVTRMETTSPFPNILDAQLKPNTRAALSMPRYSLVMDALALRLVLDPAHRTLLSSDSSLDSTRPLASLPKMSLYRIIVVIVLLGNASASIEWCCPRSRSTHNWTCLNAERSFPTCCPPGSICRNDVCSPIPSGSSDPPETTPSDWCVPFFYPNGDIEPKDMPCSSQGGACCP